MRRPAAAAAPPAAPRVGLSLPELAWVLLKSGALAVGDTQPARPSSACSWSPPSTSWRWRSSAGPTP
jgi:hypothetical protein